MYEIEELKNRIFEELVEPAVLREMEKIQSTIEEYEKDLKKFKRLKSPSIIAFSKMYKKAKELEKECSAAKSFCFQSSAWELYDEVYSMKLIAEEERIKMEKAYFRELKKEVVNKILNIFQEEFEMNKNNVEKITMCSDDTWTPRYATSSGEPKFVTKEYLEIKICNPGEGIKNKKMDISYEELFGTKDLDIIMRALDIYPGQCYEKSKKIDGFNVSASHFSSTFDDGQSFVIFKIEWCYISRAML